MRFRKFMTLRGPSIWANFPTIEAWLDLEALKDSPSDELPGFTARLTAWMPSLVEHRCSPGVRGGFFQRLERGTWMGHILEHVALELQTLAGSPVGYGRTRETYEDGVYKVVIEYEYEEVGKASLEAGRRVCLAAAHDTPIDIAAEVAGLAAILARVRPCATVRAIKEACERRHVPFELLSRDGLMRLGWGVRQRKLNRTLTDRVAAAAADLAHNRELLLKALSGVGLPVALHESAESADGAVSSAEYVGYPVVLRAQRGLSRHATHRNLATAEQVREAFARVAAASPPPVLVERQVRGTLWRLLVIGDRVEAVSVLEPADGCALPAGADATDALGAAVAAQAVEAARTLGLEVAGVDIVAPGLDRPLDGMHGAIVAVHPKPGLARHLSPAHGSARPVADALVARVFPTGTPCRIPVAAVTGVNGKTTTTRLLAHIVREALHRPVGMTNTEGVYMDGRRIESGDCSGPASARKALHHPRCEAAVLETARGGILRAGLAFDVCDVAVVTNIGSGDHLGIADIHTVDELAKVKRAIIEVVRPETGLGVLNAADPLTVAMAEKCPGPVGFFAIDPETPALAEHRSKGGKVAFVRDGRLVLAEGEVETPVVELTSVPLTHGGRVGFQVENALAAALAAWGLGLTTERIRHGLETFGTDPSALPARFNVYEVNGATVVVDYGHNVSALEKIIQTLGGMAGPGRKVAAYSAAGDRRDEDMLAQGEMLGRFFDEVILYEDSYTRGRKPGEISARIRAGVESAGRPVRVEEYQGFARANEIALDRLRPGDLMLLQADGVDETIAFMRRYQEERKAREAEADAKAGPAPAAAVGKVKATVGA